MPGCLGQPGRVFRAESPVHSAVLDSSFAALSQRGASISELALRFEMTRTGIKKHVRVLEQAGLVTSEKVGRVRTCTLGPRRLEDEAAFIAEDRNMLEARLDHLDTFLARTKGDHT